MKKTYSNLFKGVMICAALGLATPSHAGNEQRIGEAGATELLINPWARSSGFGGANSASAQGVEALFLNVAGTAFTSGTDVTFAQTRWFADINVNSFGLSQKVGEGALTITISSLDFGDIQRTTVNSPEGSLGTFSPQFINMHVAYAKKFTESIYGGVAVKIISESIGDLTANGAAFDAGVQYVTGEEKQIRFGISLKNVGAPMSFGGDGLSYKLDVPSGKDYKQTFESRSSGFELPTLLNIGGSYDFNFEDNQLRLVGNFVSNSFSSDIFQAGAQFSWRKMFMARMGYAYEKSSDVNSVRSTMFTGLSAGFTFEVPMGDSGSTFAFDYAYRDTDPFGAINTFGFRFNVD